MARQSRRIGFTLVELLVVIAIVGILLAILLPAVQAARESARTAKCMNNLKQLALGVQGFYSNKKHLPTYWGQESGFTKTTPWSVYLLPFIEEQILYDNIQGTQPVAVVASADYTPAIGAPPCGQVWTSTGTTPGSPTGHVGHAVDNVPQNTGYYTPPTCPGYVPQVGSAPYTISGGVDAWADQIVNIFQCPSDTSHDTYDIIAHPLRKSPTSVYPKKWSLTNYSPNYHLFTDGVVPAHGTNANINQVLYRATTFRRVTDGLSHTIMFGEGYANCDNNNIQRLAFWGENAGRYNNTGGAAWPTQNFGINLAQQPDTYFFQTNPPVSLCAPERLQTMHPGGVLNVVMADGSVQRLANTISHMEQSDADQPVYTTLPTDSLNPDNLAVGLASPLTYPMGNWDRLMLPNDGEVVVLDN